MIFSLFLYLEIPSTIFSEPASFPIARSLASLTAVLALFGDIVQNGKFAASAASVAHKALKRVLFPTLGIPTSPTFVLCQRINAAASDVLLLIIPVARPRNILEPGATATQSNRGNEFRCALLSK